jgi:hypothetical protein
MKLEEMEKCSDGSLPQASRDDENENCEYDDREVINESLLLGFEDDEEGAGFADNSE